MHKLGGGNLGKTTLVLGRDGDIAETPAEARKKESLGVLKAKKRGEVQGKRKIG